MATSVVASATEAHASSAWRDGWWSTARRCDSPNFGARPAGVAVELAIVHSISLPPGVYGGDAIERLFKTWPQARILWAHSGFDRPAAVREMLRKHPQLWCDLAYRTDQASGNKVDVALVDVKTGLQLADSLFKYDGPDAGAVRRGATGN